MTDIQAALGISQLKKLNKFVERRKEIERENNKITKKKEQKEGVVFRYIFQCQSLEEKERLRERMKAEGIEVDNPVFRPMHRYLDLDRREFSNTERAYETTLSIPIYPSLSEEEVKKVLNVLQSSSVAVHSEKTATPIKEL